jgi:hypothetical protein
VADHELLKSQKNQVLAVINRAELSPKDFEWTDVPTAVTATASRSRSYMVQALVHAPTDAWFIFDIDVERGHHYAIFRPGRQGPGEQINAGDWTSEIGYVQRWVEYVKREYEAPDLWGELTRQRELLADAPAEIENTPFAPEEQREIARQLREISEYVRRTHELSEAQQEVFEARLGYLEDAASRLGRIDWRNNFIGVMMTLFFESILPPETVRQTLVLTLRGLGHFFGLPGLPGG